MICPLCQKEKTVFEAHHVIWQMDGGTDDPVNLLKVCKTCHQTINYGDPVDSDELQRRCVFHQLTAHGLSFILKSGLLSSNHPLKEKMLEATGMLTPDISATEADVQMKAMAHFIYANLAR